MQYRKITFIGAGNMAQAIIAGLIAGGYPADNISVSAPTVHNSTQLANHYGIHAYQNNLQAIQQAEAIVLAVKPQIMADVCMNLKDQFPVATTLILSIAAGVRTERFYQLFGTTTLNIIRIMPNTPSLVGKGMSGLYAPPHIMAIDRLYCEQLMQSVGKICWVEQEQSINDIIAISGSAPAYFFYFMEAMQQEAEKLGFDHLTARLLIQQTISGAAAMVEQNAHLSITELKQQVVSKGGTTAQALSIFNRKQLSAIVAQAMQAARARAFEMEQLF